MNKCVEILLEKLDYVLFFNFKYVFRMYWIWISHNMDLTFLFVVKMYEKFDICL